ncbi:MAG TPA: hypothetical protein VE258_17440 [Ktedonobacterales bacterium]|nr:hypothetical protein [Ktedonobacterales bacterium]
MRRLNRVLCVMVALCGIGTFIFALRAASDPRGTHPALVLSVGIVCLIVGLSAASLGIWRGRWR